MILLTILLWILVSAISWALTCGVIYLITLCFGWTFSWALATGIWLLMFLLKAVFGHKK